MSELDDRLREILNDFNKVSIGMVISPYYDLDYCIEQIKHAFTEAGYTKLSLKPGDIMTLNGKDYRNTDGTWIEIKRMTGQEFYDRFEQEYVNYDNAGITRRDLVMMVRRAAGLPERAEQ